MRKVGKGITNLSADERDLLPTLANDERTSVVFVVQHASELEDLQILVAGVLHGSRDLQVGRECDLIGGSREGYLKTTRGTNGGTGVSTDDRKAKGDERQREHAGEEMQQNLG